MSMLGALAPLIIGATSALAVLVLLDYLIYGHIMARTMGRSAKVKRELKVVTVQLDKAKADHARAEAETEETRSELNAAQTAKSQELIEAQATLARSHEKLVQSQAVIEERERQLIIAVQAIQRLRDDNKLTLRQLDDTRTELDAIRARMAHPNNDLIPTEPEHVLLQTRTSPTATPAAGSSLQAPGQTQQLVLSPAHTAPVVSATALDNSQQLGGLAAIPGLTVENQQKLSAAGVSTLRQLAMTSPAQVRKIVDAQAWESINVENWVRHAARLEFGIS